MDPAFKRRKVELYGSDNWIEEEVNRISIIKTRFQRNQTEIRKAKEA